MGDQLAGRFRLLKMGAIVMVLSATYSCAVKTTRRTISSPDPIRIQDIRVAEGIDKTIIELESDEPILYTSFRQSAPDRLVIEMADVTFGQYQDKIKIPEGPVRSITLASSGELDVSRLEFELNGLVKTEVRPEGLNIVIEVTRLEKMTGFGKEVQVEEKHQKKFIFMGDGQEKPPATLTGKPGTEDVDALSVDIEPSIVPSLVPTAPMVIMDVPGVNTEKASSPPAVVSKKEMTKMPPAKFVSEVKFVQANGLQLVITSDGDLSPDIFFVGKNKKRLVIDFPGVKSTMKRGNILGDDLFVKQVRFGQHPKKLRLVLDLMKPVIFAWDQKQNELWVTLK